MEDLLSASQNICHLFNIHPQHSKGQNFLISKQVYDDIIKSADLKSHDIVLEVGPGLGFLTARLSEQVNKVIAVELDSKLFKMLQTAIDFQGVNNIELLNQDILKFDFRKFTGINYKIVANLPYNITSIFLRQVLSLDNRPSEIVLMLQKEVVERILAKDKYNLLALSVQLSAEAELVREVRAKNFWPQPKVDSAIVKITTIDRYFNNKEEEKLFWRMLKVGFSSKRKMLKNNLESSLNIPPEIIEEIFEKIDLDFRVRAEKLDLNKWKKLFAKLKKFMIYYK